MPISRCIAETTHREYLTWMAWLDSQWNKPSRLDHYIMQLTFHMVKNTKLKIDSFKIPFRTVKKQPEVAKVLTEDEKKFRLASDKSRWFAFLGMRNKVE